MSKIYGLYKKPNFHHASVENERLNVCSSCDEILTPYYSHPVIQAKQTKRSPSTALNKYDRSYNWINFTLTYITSKLSRGILHNDPFDTQNQTGMIDVDEK